MKKLYSAPSLELLAFFPAEPISYTSDWTDDPNTGDALINSQPWNDGELGGWT